MGRLEDAVGEGRHAYPGGSGGAQFAGFVRVTGSDPYGLDTDNHLRRGQSRLADLVQPSSARKPDAARSNAIATEDGAGS
jgi:hypothetical protein